MSGTNITLVELTIDGQAVRVPEGTTLYDAARLNGIAIPTLCHLQSQTPVGVCRLCVVDTGARVLSASCVRPVEPGMKVRTNSEKVLAARKTLLELLMADHPSPCARQQRSGDCELETLAKQAGLGTPRFARRTQRRARAGRLFTSDRGRSRSVHLVRPLYSRMRRDQKQLCAGPHGQRLSGRHCVRLQRADGRFHLRFVRGMHGVLSNRRADQ